ncbi:MAG: 50S ribosomal protein L24 [Planctomycetota bacterium]|jgi:large subunit ribosomal protein L24|nr:50S ribosomal protein L24 [Planctomycetota bacterium]
MATRLHVRRNDQVVVLSGSNVNKRGRILRVDRQRGKVVVEGVNYIKKHIRPSRQHPRGGIVEIEAPIHASNVMLICPDCSKPTRVMRVAEAQGKDGVRICKKCHQKINPTKDSK